MRVPDEHRDRGQVEAGHQVVASRMVGATAMIRQRVRGCYVAPPHSCVLRRADSDRRRRVVACSCPSRCPV